jgi:hypothetical protein
VAWRVLSNRPTPPPRLALPAGTTPLLAGFPRMRIREENCNVVLLAVVTLFAVAVAGGATLVGPTDSRVARLADRTTAPAQPPSADKRIISVGDQPPVRVVGAPFVPNTNPRER